MYISTVLSCWVTYYKVLKSMKQEAGAKHCKSSFYAYMFCEHVVLILFIM